MAGFIGRFVGPARVVVPLLAGRLGVDARRFHLANWASAILWAPLLLAPTAIAAWLTAELEALPPATRSAVSLAVIGCAVVVWMALRRRD